MPPSSTVAGTQPLASASTLDAVVNLEEGLPLEVEISPKSSAGILIGFIKAVYIERQPFAADVVLEEEDASKLLSCPTQRHAQSPPPANATSASERK
jgi:hypothetical protein